MNYFSTLFVLFFSMAFSASSEKLVLPTLPIDSTKTYQIEMTDGSCREILTKRPG